MFQLVFSGKGKSVADDGSSSDNDLPQERPAVTYTNRKNGPDLKKLDALYRPNILAMSSWSEAEYAEYDTYLVKKWECNGFDKSDNAYVVRLRLIPFPSLSLSLLALNL